MFTTVNHRRLGSALLITLLMMGVLTLFGLGLGTLLVREIRVQSEAMRAAQSLYAAEGGVERALLVRTQHDVGYSIAEGAVVPGTYENGQNDASYSYTITATGDSVPCTHELARVGADDAGYQPLAPEKTVRLPLFYEDPDGVIISNTEWNLAYKVSQAAEFRWKLFGLTDEGYTESMNGVVSISGSLSPDWYGDFENTAAFDNTFSYTQDTIQHFLSTHTYPYLVLTNLASADDESAVVYFQLTGASLTCEYARVSGDGQMSTFNVSQSVDALIHINTVLPIFDFVLYQLGDEPVIPRTFTTVQSFFSPSF